MAKTPDTKSPTAENATTRTGGAFGLVRRFGPAALGVVALIFVFVVVPIWFSEWDESPEEKQNCYQIQEIKGEWYKVDTCTGKTEKLIGPGKREVLPEMDHGKNGRRD